MLQENVWIKRAVFQGSLGTGKVHCDAKRKGKTKRVDVPGRLRKFSLKEGGESYSDLPVKLKFGLIGD